MKSYKELVEKLKKIKERGWIKTHREGNTGIGKTLEDILGIKENNMPIPNGVRTELKSARKNASSMLTLFTKSPSPARVNSVLLDRFGYPSDNKKGTKRLETTVNAIDFNKIRGKTGFKISVRKDRVNLIIKGGKIVGYWDKETLKNAFERKLPKVLYVKADTRGRGSQEEFWYNEAWLLSGFDFNNFIRLIKDGVILVDIRIGQYSNGKPHDHGTGFRVLPDKLEMCFTHRDRIL